MPEAQVKEPIVEPTRAESRAAEFEQAFGAVAPLVREEWPLLDAALLEATEGNLDRVIILVSTHVDRTRVATRRQLLELLDVALASRASNKAGSGETDPKSGVDESSVTPLPHAASNGATKTAAVSSARSDFQVDEVIAAIRRLESFAAGEAKRVSNKMVPIAEAKVRQNLWVSIIMALGFGMIVGLWLNGGRKQR